MDAQAVSTDAAVAASIALTGAEEPMVLGIGAIHLPDYLDRLRLVTRIGTNRLQVDDFHRWAAPLQDDIQRVFGDNLKALTEVQRVVFHPWTSNQKPDLVIDLDIHAFRGAFRWRGISQINDVSFR